MTWLEHHQQQSLLTASTWFSLQHFAKAQEEGRTEEPTERKKRKSREEGKVAKSSDLTQAIVLLITLFTIAVVGKNIVISLTQMIHFYFSQIGENPTQNQQNIISVNLAQAFYSYYFRSVGIIFFMAFISAFISMSLQVGFVYASKAIKPDFQKIIPNFIRYFHKTLFSVEAFYNITKSIFKVFIIGLIGYVIIIDSTRKLSTLSYSSMSRMIQFLLQRIFTMIFISSIFMLILAIVDYLFQKYQFNESIKMTKQEIKDEVKEEAGNPKVKSLMRQRMMELMRSSMIQNVPKADVIITNPTHFSVALEYIWGAQAPRVTAKGEDLIALKIREIANTHSVPIVENRPLARALYSTVEIGDEVPEQFLKIVAEILISLPKIQSKMKNEYK